MMASASAARTPRPHDSLSIEVTRGPLELGAASARLVRPGEAVLGFEPATRLMRFDRAFSVRGCCVGRVSGFLATRSPSPRDIERRIESETLDSWATTALRGELFVRHRVEARVASTVELVVSSVLINPFSGTVRRQILVLDAEHFVVDYGTVA